MAVSSSTTITEITEAQLNDLGFFLIEEGVDTDLYVMNQYSLFYNSTTNLVKVKIGKRSNTVSWEFISIVLNNSELETLLKRNSIIS